MPELQNLQTFNYVLGVVFDHLLTNFPMRQPIDTKELSEMLTDVIEVAEKYEERDRSHRHIGKEYMKGSGVLPKTYLAEVADWLTHEGFLIRYESKHGRDKYRLTLQALDILGRRPAGLEKSLGEQLTDAVKASGNEIGKATIGEVVGQIIGAAARGFTTT